jgi:hypothetical protein
MWRRGMGRGAGIITSTWVTSRAEAKAKARKLLGRSFHASRFFL